MKAGKVSADELDFIRVTLQIFHEKHFLQRIIANEDIWKVVSIDDWNKYHISGTGKKQISGSITQANVYKSNPTQEELVDILGLNYTRNPYVGNTNGYVRIETKATDAMATDCRMPFNADVDKTNLGPPQTFTGFAASENSKYIVPELYLNGDRKDLAVGSVAKVFDSNGKLINEYTLKFENNIWEWKK